MDDWCLLLRSIITTFYIDTEIYLNYFIFFFFFFFFSQFNFQERGKKRASIKTPVPCVISPSPGFVLVVVDFFIFFSFLFCKRAGVEI